jgi:DNA-binding HxlR family transcriptional regulator/putative sterol carrier protein
MDTIGERWAVLIVRELLLGPKRFTDLRAGLPGASPNILSERLRELEAAGVVRRRTLPPPARARVYELTEWGQELEPVMTKLAGWAVRSPLPPAHTRVGADPIVLALRVLFDPERAAGLDATYELRLDGERFRVDVADGEIVLARGAAEAPDLVIEADPESFAAVLTGQLELDEALGSGEVRLEGPKTEASRFFGAFSMPEPCLSAEDQAGAPAESGVEATR